MMIIKGERTTRARINNFVRFVVEREVIRQRKEAGFPRPWTNDHILQTYHFCNVRRADDRVTRWIGNWLDDKMPLNHWWFYCAVARWFNEPETLEYITPYLRPKWRPAAMVAALDSYKEQGHHIFRGSYIITGAIVPEKMSKHKAVVMKVLDTLYRKPPLIFDDNIEASWLSLRNYPGQGSFMAGQIVADWQTFGIIHGKDVKTWAPLGPGSSRGLQYIYGEKFGQKEAVEKMRELGAVLALDTMFGKTLTLHDVQNTLCEFSKYCRGYSKTKYVPYREQHPGWP